AGDRQRGRRRVRGAHPRPADHRREGLLGTQGGARVSGVIRLTVNGTAHELEVPASRTLLDCLRNDLGLTGSKEGCGVGVCGACTVLLDGKMISSCIALAAFADGRSVTTVEGLAQDERLHPVQQAFVDAAGFQYGICTPGQVVS